MGRRKCRRSLLLVATLSGVILAAVGGAANSTRLALTGPASPAPLPTLDAAQVMRGRQIYLQSCAACHGANAQGAPSWYQPDASGNLPPPPHDDTGHTWRHGDAELTGIIRNGLRDVFNKTPELTMPPFKDRLSDAEIAAVITYFKSLWSPAHRRYQEAQSRRPPMATPEASR